MMKNDRRPKKEFLTPPSNHQKYSHLTVFYYQGISPC